MLSSALGALTDRVDSKFLAAFWLPAFVAVLGSLGLLGAVVGKEQMADWVYGFDSVEQSWVVLILLLVTTMLAFVLRALTGPIPSSSREISCRSLWPSGRSRVNSRSSRRPRECWGALPSMPPRCRA